MTYGYDCLGRVIEVRSPMNGSATVSLRHFYYTSGRPGYHNFARYHYHNWTYYDHTAYRGDQMRHDRPYSITEHYDDNGRLTTRTVVITDGFGRVLQTKKGLTNGNVPSMQVSGRAKVDRFGRATRQYGPFAVADTALASLGRFEPYIDSSATVTAYDVLDRATKVRRPLGVTPHSLTTTFGTTTAEDDASSRR